MMVRTRLRTVLALGATLGIVAGVAFAGTVGAAPTLAGNRHAAQIDAVRLLGRLRLPPGASGSATDPPASGDWLKPAPGLTATTARIDVHAWWRVPGTPAAVLAYIRAHPPAGSRLFATGSSGSVGSPGSPAPGASDSAQSLDFSWPPPGGVLLFRELAVTVTALPGGQTGVLGQAESDWIVPRPVSERIPAATRDVDITSALSGRPTISVRVTRPATVRRIVAIFDALPTAQPVFYACPLLLNVGARVITFRFRAGPQGRQLAQATYTAYPHLATSGPCNAIQFTISGRRQTALLGGAFMRRIQRLVPDNLTGGG
jgi:hypothetical protein